jgi:branched-chain amino acid transport system ATP-binding protein
VTRPLLEARDIVAGYEPGVPIVRGASFFLHAGQILVLLGPNGAGKSTLVKAVAGLVHIETGEVRLAGASLAGVPAHQRIRHGLAFVPQTGNVFAGLTVSENLDIATAVLPRRDRAARVAAMFSLFPDLAAARRAPAGRLSGGQRQMLAIARALAVGPRVLALDEPSAGLSPKLVAIVMAKLREVRAGGVAVLLVEQNARAALAVADRAAILVEGRVAHAGSGAALLDDPAVAALYLGRLPDTGAPAPSPLPPPPLRGRAGERGKLR